MTVSAFIFSFMKMANQRKRTYDTYQKPSRHHRSPSSVYWAESSSTLTVSSQQTQQIDLQQDQGGWCADKMRKQRKKMEKLVMCYEQQRKCIAQLEEYIDQLEKSNQAKDQEISHLQLSRKKNTEASQAQSDFQKQMASGQQAERSKMMSLINGQLRLYDLQRHRWQKQIEAKEQELLDQKELFEEQIEANHKFYKEKLMKSEIKWMNVEKDLANDISRLQKDNAELKEQINSLTEKLQSHNQFQEIIKLRRQLSKRESQVSCSFDKTQVDNHFLKEQLQKAKAQIKRLKKENCKLKNDMQSRMFDQQIGQKIFSSMQAKRQLSKNKQSVDSEYIKKYESLQKEMKKVKKELNQFQRKCQVLTLKNEQLQNEINCLNCLFTQRKEKQRKWQSLRKEEHQQIQNLNKLFKKIDLTIL